MELEIDYSAIPQTHTVTTQEDWEPPVHKYFGKKDPQTGKMEKEPTYYHQEYPRVFYAMKDGKIIAKQVNSEEEKNKLGEGWVKNFIEFGHISAPSFEQRLEIQEAKEAREAAELIGEAPRVGRPKKAA